MKAIHAAVLLSMLSLSAVAQESDAPPVSNPDANIPLTDVQLEVVRAALEERLLDAESARFLNVVIGDDRIGQAPGMKVLCGKVNAKNRMGAYVGYSTFVGIWVYQDDSGPTQRAIIQRVDGGKSSVASEMCLDQIGYM